MIELVNLSKQYGTFTAVNNIHLTIPAGEIFGFLGPNGAGKTTTIKMLAGLTRPRSGRVMIGGASVEESRVRERVGFMPEAPYFYDRLTGMEFLKFCGDLFVRHPKSTAGYGELLERVGIFAARHKPIATYSKGMKQRLAFASALVNDPDYLLLDEPLDGLDPIGRAEIKAIIAHLHRAGKTVFFNSHILYDTEELCDSIGILHQGALLYAGPVEEFCAGKTLEERFVEVVGAHVHHPKT